MRIVPTSQVIEVYNDNNKLIAVVTLLVPDKEHKIATALLELE